MAASHNFRIVKVVEERGSAGIRETMDRPGWNELTVALQTDGVRVVLIEKLDRLARDLMVQESVIAELGKHGFELVFSVRAGPDGDGCHHFRASRILP